jgi:hypothetical protein
MNSYVSLVTVDMNSYFLMYEFISGGVMCEVPPKRMATATVRWAAARQATTTTTTTMATGDDDERGAVRWQVDEMMPSQKRFPRF